MTNSITAELGRSKLSIAAECLENRILQIKESVVDHYTVRRQGYVSNFMRGYRRGTLERIVGRANIWALANIVYTVDGMVFAPGRAIGEGIARIQTANNRDESLTGWSQLFAGVGGGAALMAGGLSMANIPTSSVVNVFSVTVAGSEAALAGVTTTVAVGGAVGVGAYALAPTGAVVDPTDVKRVSNFSSKTKKQTNPKKQTSADEVHLANIEKRLRVKSGDDQVFIFRNVGQLKTGLYRYTMVRLRNGKLELRVALSRIKKNKIQTAKHEGMHFPHDENLVAAGYLKYGKGKIEIDGLSMSYPTSRTSVNGFQSSPKFKVGFGVVGNYLYKKAPPNILIRLKGY